MSKSVFELPQGMQRAILYLFKSNEDFHHTITNLVKKSYFELPIHQNIFSVVHNYRAKYKLLPTDDIVLNEVKAIMNKGELISEYDDELTYCNKAGEYAFDNIEYILEKIEVFAKRAASKEALEKAVELAKDDRFDEIHDLFKTVSQVSRLSNVGHDYFDGLEIRVNTPEEKKKKYPVFLARANKELDGGHSPKELCMVVAPPGVGKSLFLVNQSVHLMRKGLRVVYVSLEMSEEKIAQRFDSVITEINIKNTKIHKPEVIQGVKNFCSEHPGSGLVIKEFPTGQANVNHIRVLLTQLKNQNKFVPDVLCVDYLELLRPTRNVDSEYAAQQRIAEELRGLGVELGILVWTATQTNRDARKATLIKDVHMADSYGKVRTADWIVSLNQTDEERDRGRMRTYVLKARDSKNNYIIPTNVDYATLAMFDDMDSELSQEDQ